MKLILLSAIAFCYQSAFAQFVDSTASKVESNFLKRPSIQRSLNLLTGLSWGRYLFADIGISKSKSTSAGPHPFWGFSSISSEVLVGNELIAGPKLGFWGAGGAAGVLGIGLNLIDYTNFRRSSIVFRPEIGFGTDRVKVVYGFNAILSKYKLAALNRNLLNLSYCIRLKQLPDK